MEQNAELAQIYLDFLQSISAQISELNLHTHYFTIAEDYLSVSATQSSDLATFEAPIAHMAGDFHSATAAIYLINRADLPKSFTLPKFPYLHFENEKMRFYFNSEIGSLEILDYVTTRHFVISNNPSQSHTIFSSSNIHYLRPILNNLGYVNMHGAVLGRDGEGVFLSNKGGSGKSTLMAYGAARGMQTLGDDFLTMKPNEPNRFHSLYRQFKIAKSSPALDIVTENFPRLGSFDGKEVFAIEGESGDIFQSEMRIKEILIPVVGEQLRVIEISKEDALERILASNILLNWKIEKTIVTVKRLLDTLPFALLEVTSDLESAYQLIEQRLKQ